jgi:hypothetical protein
LIRNHFLPSRQLVQFGQRECPGAVTNLLRQVLMRGGQLSKDTLCVWKRHSVGGEFRRLLDCSGRVSAFLDAVAERSP